jgi:hypothetical protein
MEEFEATRAALDSRLVNGYKTMSELSCLAEIA